jgi:LacI family transcriptional regulator/LacI family repressor for deo operon, udp, cdd, tsx, nupC, and nupG
LDECSERVGEASVELLVKMIHNGEKGVPVNRSSMLIQGEWIEGKTLRP